MKKKNSVSSKSDVFTVEVSKVFEKEIKSGLAEVTKSLGMPKGHIAGNSLIAGIDRARDIIKEHDTGSNEPEWKQCRTCNDEIELAANGSELYLRGAMTPRNFDWINKALNAAMKAAGINLQDHNILKIFLTEYYRFPVKSYLGVRAEFQRILTKRILEDSEKLKEIFSALHFVQYCISDHFLHGDDRDKETIPADALKRIFKAGFKQKEYKGDTFRPAIPDPAGKLRGRIEKQFKKSALSREGWYRKLAEAGLAVMESKGGGK